MKISDVFSKALFKTPKYNVFPQSNEVKFSGRLGKLYPVQRWLMNPGDSIDVNLQQLVRFSPLIAPIMHRFQVDFQAIEIPDRLAIPILNGRNVPGFLDGGFENFHNLSSSSPDCVMPSVSIRQLLNVYLGVSINPIGSLMDALGYPTFSDLYRKLADDGVFDTSYFGRYAVENTSGDRFFIFGATEADKISIFADPIFPISFAAPLPAPFDAIGKSYRVQVPDVEYQRIQISSSLGFSFIDWLVSKYFKNESYASLCKRFGIKTSLGSFFYAEDPDQSILEPDAFTLIQAGGEEDGEYIDRARYDELIDKMLESINLSSFDAIDQFNNEVFFGYLNDLQLALNDDQTVPSPTSSKKYSLLPLYAFWSAYYDWYRNSNIDVATDNSKLEWFDSIGLCINDSDSAGQVSTQFGYLAHAVDEGGTALQIPNRLWEDDYFTSAFILPSEGGDVMIPQNGTIRDLRNAGSIQRLYEKLMYTGKRYIDQVLGVFGVHSSNERLDRCRVLGTAHFGVNVSDVTQTSSDTLDSRLGDYAGQAITVGQNGSFIHYTAEEHSIIMVFMSVRPKSMYIDQTPPDLFKLRPLDFLVPEFAHVGEQPVLSSEIVPLIKDSEDDPSVFGFQRRYSEYMFSPSRVFGEMKTSLRYWHDARVFDDGEPFLNKDFIFVDDEKDGLNRIFAVPEANENLRCFLYFDTVISRPLSKFVEYHY